jgi:hypothetical protein
MRDLPPMQCPYRHRTTWENVRICDGASLAIAKLGTQPFKEQWDRMKKNKCKQMIALQ